MKKMTLNAKAATTVLAAALVLSSVSAIAAELPASPKYTKDQAKQIALNHFGITETDITKTNYEFNDGKHEFEFSAEGIRYECDVNDLTGNVVDSEIKSKLLDNAIVSNYIRNNGYISSEEAGKLALDKFGIAADAAVADYEIELDDDDYEVEFTAGGVKYECDVNAVTGKIIYFKSGKQPLTSTTQSTKGVARNAALEHFGIADDVQITGLSIDADDDRYEVEFHLNGVKYECDVNKYTNAVIKARIDGDDDNYTAAKGYISRAEAQEIALKALGITADDYTWVDAELDDGDYEFEFKGKGIDYECEVDAATGNVIYSETDGKKTASAKTSSVTAAEKLTKEEALALAHTALGITADDYYSLDIELDDGEYEFDFDGRGYNYECDINVTTGAVSDIEKERDNDDDWDD